jgi:hypothetical protein
MKKITIFCLIFSITLNTQAQLGGLLKKAKEKVTQKKEVKETKQEDAKEEVTTTSKVVNNKTMSSDPNTPDTYYLVNNPLGKISFSNQPFLTSTVSGKTSFASKEFIYGRLQLNSGTIKEALKIEEKNNKNPYYNFEYVVTVYRKKENKYNNEQLWNNCLLKDADLDKNYLDFDVLPNPDKATTIISALSDFSAGKSTAPLYAAIQPTIFDEDGIYKVNIIIRNPAKDNWGNLLTKDKWPTFEADFDFDFSSNDFAMLKKNKDLASSKAEYAIKNAITPLPKQWSEKSSVTTMDFTQAQLITMYENSFDTKLDPHTVIKFHASNSSGGWTTQNNDYGIPIYRYSNQWYTIFIKYTTGVCFYQGFGLRQQYNGGGTYGKAFIDKNEYYMTDCGLMK